MGLGWQRSFRARLALLTLIAMTPIRTSATTFVVLDEQGLTRQAAVVATGLVAFALYSLSDARYRRI